jgi:tellurite methyltransferase
MTGVPRAVVGFSQDGEGHWVAELTCGHGQHVRHQPPWQLRPWVQTEEGRQSHLGILLDCVKCSMPELPAGAAPYKVIGPFSEATIPAGFLRKHALKPGVWGRIVVLDGQVRYVIERDPEVSFVLLPGEPGIVLPEEPHRVEAIGPVHFQVEFHSKDQGPSG